MDDLVIGYSKNLSKGGLFLRTEKFLPVDTLVRLHIELPDGGGEITVSCRVAFVRDATDWGSVGQPPGMGIQFLETETDAKERVEKFIAECATQEEPTVESRKKPLDVLVVDDDEPYCTVASEPFRARGDTVRIAHDGIEALAQCLKRAPDVILCDVQMPRMDGWQFLRLVRARPALAAVPFVFLTTLQSEEDRLLGYKLGVDDYIAKPYKPREVVARCDRAVARAERSKKSDRPRATLRGDLQQVGLASVLSFLELEKKTGVLVVSGATSASIWIRDGSPLRVEGEIAVGPSAPEGPRGRIFALLDLPTGTFEFGAQSVDGRDELNTTFTSLLLEHARRQDEQVD